MRVAIITPGHYAVLLSVSLLMCVIHPRGVPGCTSGKEPACQCRRHRDPGLISGWRRSPWRGAWQATPVFLPEKPMDKGNLDGYSPKGRKKSNRKEVT